MPRHKLDLPDLLFRIHYTRKGNRWERPTKGAHPLQLICGGFIDKYFELPSRARDITIEGYSTIYNWPNSELREWGHYRAFTPARGREWLWLIDQDRDAEETAECVGRAHIGSEPLPDDIYLLIRVGHHGEELLP